MTPNNSNFIMVLTCKLVSYISPMRMDLQIGNFTIQLGMYTVDALLTPTRSPRLALTIDGSGKYPLFNPFLINNFLGTARRKEESSNICHR